MQWRLFEHLGFIQLAILCTHVSSCPVGSSATPSPCTHQIPQKYILPTAYHQKGKGSVVAQKGQEQSHRERWRICCRGLEDVRTVGALVILLVTVRMEDHESLMQGEFIWTLRLGTLKFNLLLWLVVGCVSCSMLH